MPVYHRSVSTVVFCVAVFLFFCSIAAAATGTEKNFTQFGMILPPGWDGDEQSGFISDNRDEYMISVAKKAENEDRYTAQLSIYLLPNPGGHDSEHAARMLAEAQAESATPALVDNFWVFRGEPRTTIVKGPAKTLVRTNPERMLIIIAQDTGNEADAIIESLHGLTPEARALLGR